jgi:hypothetical protein
MHPNSKKFLVISETREITVITRNRPIFRKVHCPHCGMETGLFERESQPVYDAGNKHVFICLEHQEASKKLKK